MIRIGDQKMKKNVKIHETKNFDDVRALIEWAAETYGEKTAYSFKLNPHSKELEKRSFINLRDDVRALATEIVGLGLRDKNCVVIGKFTYNWVVTYFSLLCAGATIVPLDRDWAAEDLAETALKAEAKAVFCDADILEKGKTVAEKCGLSSVITLAGEGEVSVDNLLASGAPKYAADPSVYLDYKIDADRLSLLVFTSGTTGKGKGVMLNQRAILSDLSSIIPYIDFADKTVGVLPPHHTYGSSVMFIGHAMIGCEIYISAGLRYVVNELKEQKPGHLVFVPLYLETFYRKITATVKDQGKEKLVRRMMKFSNFLRKIGIDLRRKFFKALLAPFGGDIKMIISGGAPINSEILEFFDGIGITTLNGYGITECAPIIAVNQSRNVIPGSVGPALDIDTVKIADPNEDGEGEICVKGPNVMLGYYKDEDATAAAFDEDGFFKTGDYGKFGKDNAIFITGRLKNLIILSNGKNVYPEEIESEFIAVPGVVDVIVYEGKSKRGMEHNAIVCEIYPDRDLLEKNSITDPYKYFHEFVDKYNRTAVPYKKIGVLRVREEEFPKNTLRKILRFKLDMTID